MVARVHAQHRDRAYRFLVVLLRLFEEGRAYSAAPADAPGVLLKRCPDAFDLVVDPFAGDRFVVHHGWISSCSGRSAGGAFSSRQRVPLVLDPGRSAARHRAVVGCGSTRFPSSPRWTNVPLDVRSGSGSSCAFRAALVVLVPVVEVWPLDAIRAVCGAGRIVDEALRRRPQPCRDPGRRRLSLDAWSVLFSVRSLRLRCSAGRPFGSCFAEAHCSG